jgi:hypothetical protein
MRNGLVLPNGDLELQNASAPLSPRDASDCFDKMTPTCLRQLYNTIDYEPQAQGGNGLGIAGYGESPSQSDLTQFMGLFRSDAAGATLSARVINGGADDQTNPGIEVGTVLHAMAYVPVTCKHTG